MNQLYAIVSRLFICLGIVLFGLAAFVAPDRPVLADFGSYCAAQCYDYQYYWDSWEECVFDCCGGKCAEGEPYPGCEIECMNDTLGVAGCGAVSCSVSCNVNTCALNEQSWLCEGTCDNNTGTVACETCCLCKESPPGHPQKPQCNCAK